MDYVCSVMVVCNLIVNFYKCLVLGYEVLVYVVWFVFNCFLMVWILSECGMGIWLELWFVDLFVNLYLVIVVILVVGLDGLKCGLKLVDSVDENIYVMIEVEW